MSATLSACIGGIDLATNKSGKRNIAATVKALIAPVVEQMVFLLWDVSYMKEGASWNLVVTIDSPDGITITDCEHVTHAINPILDKADPIPDSYYLEVSSPGLERVLKSDEQFAAMVGSNVEVSLFVPAGEDMPPAIVGQKIFIATLGEKTSSALTLTVDTLSFLLENEKIARVKTIYEE